MKIYKEVVVIEVRGKPRENSDHENKKKQVFPEEGSVLLRGQVSSENIGINALASWSQKLMR